MQREGLLPANQLTDTNYLIYRDIKRILTDHLLSKSQQIKVLDYGVGNGSSAKIILTILIEMGFSCELHGVDIHPIQIEAAKKLLPQGHFKTIKLGETLDSYRDFDLVICHFVLLENNRIEMENIPKIIYPILKENGIAIFTNHTSNVYHPQHKFYGIRSHVPPTKLLFTSPSGKSMPQNGAEVTIKITEKNSDNSTYTNFFYHGGTYLQAFAQAGFLPRETWKPTAENDPLCPWRHKGKFSDDKPIYRIDICQKKTLPPGKNIFEKRQDKKLGIKISRIALNNIDDLIKLADLYKEEVGYAIAYHHAELCLLFKDIHELVRLTEKNNYYGYYLAYRHSKLFANLFTSAFDVLNLAKVGPHIAEMLIFKERDIILPLFKNPDHIIQLACQYKSAALCLMNDLEENFVKILFSSATITESLIACAKKSRRLAEFFLTLIPEKNKEPVALEQLKQILNKRSQSTLFGKRHNDLPYISLCQMKEFKLKI